MIERRRNGRRYASVVIMIVVLIATVAASWGDTRARLRQLESDMGAIGAKLDQLNGDRAEMRASFSIAGARIGALESRLSKLE